MTFEAALNALWPHGDEHILGLKQGIIATSRDVFERYGLTSPLVIAHAMAQFSEECGDGAEVVENLNYTSASRIVDVWPARFTTASAVAYVRNPQKLADKVYNGRMGNRPGSDDGYNYRGRGGAQTTGRIGYETLSKKVGLDLIANPDLVNDPAHFLECAVADFVICGCLPFAEKNDIRGVTHHLNGGYTNLADRQTWLKRWKIALDVGETAVAAEPGLGIGDKGWEVEAAQKQLSALGYQVGKVDSDFGNGTRNAVLAFQADNGLPTTGRVDDATKVALATSPPKPVAEERAATTEADLRASGSGTIKDADKLVTGAKITGTVAAITGAHQGGLLDSIGISDVSDVPGKLSMFKEIASGVGDALTFVEGNLWIVIVIVAAAAVWYGCSIRKRRVDDHRAGLNMGR